MYQLYMICIVLYCTCTVHVLVIVIVVIIVVVVVIVLFRKLRKILSEASSEQARQKKELEKVINERDILGTQLIRRNDELALLYEKIKIQQSTLSKGQLLRSKVNH